MDAVTLLGYVTEDLQGRISEPYSRADADPRREYELFRAAGLLRLMLLDKPSLLQRAADDLGMTPTFTIRAALRRAADGTLKGPIGFTAGPGNFGLGRIGLAPHPDSASMTLTLEEFVNAPSCSSTDGQVATVTDVIRTAAYAYGGVHFYPAGRVSDPKAKRLALFLLEAQFGGGALAPAVSDAAHVAVATCTELLLRRGLTASEDAAGTPLGADGAS